MNQLAKARQSARLVRSKAKVEMARVLTAYAAKPPRSETGLRQLAKVLIKAQELGLGETKVFHHVAKWVI